MSHRALIGGSGTSAGPLPSRPAIPPGDSPTYSSAEGLTSTISLSLVSHTNAGKTTLARTLLGRDVGEVRDEAHVTDRAESHGLVDSPAGDRLLLWDTPGFGDSQRLARRLQAAGSPLGWLMTQVWDRWRDRPFWASQQAIRHVMAQTDVALYLVNAAEAPEDAAYVAAELQVLALLNKPVIVLLNQLGPPGRPADEAQQVLRWQDHLAGLGGVHGTLALDAFARCWVQEALLLQAVAAALPADRQAAMARLQASWALQHRHTWQAAMTLLAGRLARAALDREPLPAAGWAAPLRGLGQALGRQLGLSADAGPDPQARAMAALADRLASDIRRSTDGLIHLHGLQGRAGGELSARLASYFARPGPVSEGRAALWGGVVTGALAGLKADLASGGLTMGGGLLAGGLLGALGAAGAVRGFNKVRGLDQPLLAWDEPVLQSLLSAGLLTYLALAHHGRGRGEWCADEPPAAWTEAVAAVLAGQQGEWQALWAQRAAWLALPPQAADAGPPSAGGTAASAPPSRTGAPDGGCPAAAPAAYQDALQHLLGQACTALLARLYPEAAGLLGLSTWLASDLPASPSDIAGPVISAQRPSSP